MRIQTALRGKEFQMDNTFKTLADVRKALTDEQIVKLANNYLKNKEYHKKRNRRVNEGYKLAVANNLVK